MDNPVLLLTGPIRSGKTGALEAWAAGRDLAGFLTPDSPRGRMMLNLATGERLSLEASPTDEDTISVGRFRFLRSSFEAGARWFREGLARNAAWLVMDEIGPLEISGGGFDALLRETLAVLGRSECRSRLLLVMREGIVDEAVERYGLGAAQRIEKSHLGKLDAKGPS